MQKLGLIKENSKTIFPLLTTRPRTMTFADYQLLTTEQKQGEIVVTDYPAPDESDKVEVTAISGDTYKSLLNRLFGLVDISKITDDSTLVINNNEIFTIQSKTSTELIFTLCAIGDDTRQYVRTFILNTANSRYMYGVLNYVAQAMAVNDYADESVYATFTIYYNSVKTLELGTLAENCMMSDGVTSVEDAVDDMFVQTTVTPNISVPAQGYNFYSYDKPSGYKLISVNMEQNSLAIFSQITNFGTTDRISFFNAYTQAITLDQSITLTFVKI